MKETPSICSGITIRVLSNEELKINPHSQSCFCNYHHQNYCGSCVIFAIDRNLNLRPAPTLPTPAVVEQHTEQDEHQQSQRAQDGEQEQGVVRGDVPQAWMRQTQSCKTNHGRKKSLRNFTSPTRCSTYRSRSDRTRRSKTVDALRFTC